MPKNKPTSFHVHMNSEFIKESSLYIVAVSNAIKKRNRKEKRKSHVFHINSVSRNY
jgi:hypothetical protein